MQVLNGDGAECVPGENNSLITQSFNSPDEFANNCANLVNDAFKALKDVLTDRKSPAAARVAAANAVLDRAERAIERSRPLEEREPADLSAGELASLVRKLERRLAAETAQDAQILPKVGDIPSSNQ
jgi:hypothetical protein